MTDALNPAALDVVERVREVIANATGLGMGSAIPLIAAMDALSVILAEIEAELATAKRSSREALEKGSHRQGWFNGEVAALDRLTARLKGESHD